MTLGLATLLPISTETRAAGSLSWTDYQRMYENFGFNGIQYVVPQSSVAKLTALEGQRNPIVAACVRIRMAVFAEATFQFQTYAPAGKLFGKPALRLLEHPWLGGTTQMLLATMESDVSFYGNSYWLYRDEQLHRLDPTHVKIITADLEDTVTGAMIGKTLVAYAYVDQKGKQVATFLPEEIVHYKPIIDPEEPYRGLSWLSAILPDISADQDMTTYKTSFLRNSATPNLVVTFKDGTSPESIEKFRDRMEAFHTSPDQAFKTLYVGSGADVKAIGANFADMEFAAVQSQGETRIAAAAGVPAALIGIAEGLKGSTLNEGNFSATRRAFADVTIRPLWRSVCGALENVVKVPKNTRLWYDSRDIPFLQADENDAAAIRQQDATTMTALVSAGYDPDSVRDSIMSGSWAGLTHTGFLSVQLQPIADTTGTAPEAQPTLPATAPPELNPGE